MNWEAFFVSASAVGKPQFCFIDCSDTWYHSQSEAIINNCSNNTRTSKYCNDWAFTAETWLQAYISNKFFVKSSSTCYSRINFFLVFFSLCGIFHIIFKSWNCRGKILCYWLCRKKIYCWTAAILSLIISSIKHLKIYEGLTLNTRYQPTQHM